MAWIPIAAWCFAALLALVVLGFCAYEIVWKAQRLQRDLGRLQKMNDQLVDLQGEFAAAQQRLSSVRLR
jgi:hypothetical protein